MQFLAAISVFYSEKSMRNWVGVELATLIFSGCVNLDQSGNLQDTKAESDEFTPETVQFRAIAAYEYLMENESGPAKTLRNKLNKSLAIETKSQIWNPSAVKQFESYYQTKNPEALNEKAYVESIGVKANYSPRINLNAAAQPDSTSKPDQENKDLTKPGI